MKPLRVASLLCSVFMLTPLAACQGKSAAPAKQAGAKQGEAKAPESKTSDAKVPPATTPEAAPAGDGAAPTPAKNLGAHMADPPWFRRTIFGDEGKVLDTKRSEADDQGRFSSLIRFELTDMTVEGCADHLEGMVKEDVTNVKRETKDDGRIQITGSTDAFRITFMCGEAKGKTIAYVSYAWT